MAFLWGPSAQQQEWDQLIDKTTSDLLPANSHVDLATALHLADLLRSAQVPAAHATKSLVQRLQHPNPNVQLLALEVADLCVKNGGTPFLVTFAKGAADGGAAAELELLARGVKAGGGVHRDVKDRVLARLQDWATAFKGKDQLRDAELVRVYDRLQHEGVQFPPRDPTATAAMVDSLSAPDWTDAPYCTRCRTEFTTFNRKHHCRNCGHVFDAQCSASTAPLPHYGILEPVRVCDACARKIREGKGASVAAAAGLARRSSFGGSGSARPPGVERSKTSGGVGAAGRKDQEDEDLRRAIEASLAEVEPDSLPRRAPAAPLPPAAPGYNPSYAAQVSDAKGSAKVGAGAAEEDADLAAAIAASLRDLQPPATAPALARSETASTLGAGAVTYAEMFPRAPAAAPAHAPRAAMMTLPSYDLSAAESASLSDFIALYASPSHVPPSHPGARERGLYDAAGAAQARLARAAEDARRRGEILREMEWKLAEAARLYGAGLTERANYRSPSLAPRTSYLAHSPHPAAHAAPVHAGPDIRYQYAPPAALSGQPLPAYAVPPAAPAPVLAPREEYAPPPQPQHAPPPQPPVPAGFYKPSQFPSVPTGAQAALFPSVPAAEPWRREGEREGEESEGEREEEASTGELIEL
ncbi:Vacuolar protein-sorting-associated protein 27 [Rhodotorula kratochvilovae]